MAEWIEMACKKMGYCSKTVLPVLILESRDQRRFLPVFVSYPEWTLLSCPGYPDLAMEAALWPVIDGLLVALQSEVTRVRVQREETAFFGQVVIDGLLGERVLETRAGEAIAVALRVNKPIYVLSEQVIERDKAAPTSCPAADERCLGGAELCTASSRHFASKKVGVAD